MNLSEFSLLKEDNDSFTVGHPQGKSLMVPKKGLSDKAQKLISSLKKEQGLADGGDVQEEEPEEGEALSVNTTPTPMPSPEEFNQKLAANIPAQPPETQANPPSTAAQAELSNNQPEEEEPKVAAPAQEANNPLPADQANMTQGLEASKSQIGKEQKQLEEAQKNNQYPLKDIPTSDEIFNKYQTQDKVLSDAYHNKKVDPDRYWNNKSTGSKIAASIGLILGGMGGALTGRANPALENINRAISNDIDAQRSDQSQAFNLWKMNKDAMGSEAQANLATQNQMLNAAKYKMSEAQATTQNAMAQQQLNQAKTGIEQQIATNNWMRSRLSGGAPGTEQQHVAEMNVMQQLRPDLYKDMQSKYLPGVGIARVPVEKANKDAFLAFDEMQKAVNDAKAFQANVGTVIPGTPNAAAAESKKQAIALAMNKLNGLNRLNEAELRSFQGMIDGVGGFRTSRANAQLDELTNQIQRKKQSEMGSLGIVPFKQAQSTQQAKIWAQQNMNSTDPMIKQKAVQIAQMIGGQ